MNRKKFIGWVVGIPAFIVILMIIIVLNEPEKEGISRALASKAITLSITSKTACQESGGQTSRFSVQEKGNWYVKYMDYLYESGYLSEEITPATAKSAEEQITYQEIEFLAKAVSDSLQNCIKVTKKNRNKVVPAEQWWSFYEELLKETDPDGAVLEQTILLYGTPLNLPDSSAWMAYTNQGMMGFEGLGMDSYIDCELKVMVREGEIITIKELISDRVIYENVWLTSGSEETFRIFLGNISREFPLNASLGKAENLVNNLADVYLKKGKLEKIVLKKERITGKILAVRDDFIEIEGYGNVLMDDNFKVYKVYGEFKQQKLTDILVGYDMQEFVVANGKLCAALTVRAFDAKSIRVLLMDTGFNSIFHPSVTLVSENQMLMLYGEEEKVIPAGEEIYLDGNDERLKEGRIVFQLQSASESISIPSIQRAQGTPAYGGRLEIKKEADGLVVVNELFLEDYLTKVVPSEMPTSYEKEALKAQAVCARTYAYKQIQGNTYSQYGAHVDDSTRFQVYNNITADTRTQEAVNETYGKMLLLNGSPVEAYYFSTSCGHTTDGTIWGADISAVPYLQGIEVKSGGSTGDTANLTTNEEFSAFIKDKNRAGYETSFPMYRWETTVTNRQLEEKIKGVGTILNLTMTERGVGGIGKTLRVEGSEGTMNISGQGQIRSLLGNQALKIKKQDGEYLTGWDTLPSAFIAIEVDGIDEKNVTTFHIYGGGFGHGVGMSQNGAQGMAKAGKNYEEILTFFYEGIEVKEIGETS